MVSNYFKFAFQTLKKDLLIFFSYKFPAISSIFLIFANTILFFYFSKLVNTSSSEQIINSSYYVYVIYGIMISDYTVQVINRLPLEIRNYQLTGVLESFLNSKFSLSYIILPTSFFSIMFSFFKISMYIIFGYILFDISLLKIENFLYLILILISFSFFLLGIGFIAASYTILFKKGNPISFIYIFLASSVGETFIPIDLLPSFVNKFSEIVPTRKCLELLRKLENEILDSVNMFNDIFLFFLYGLCFFFIGKIIFSFSVSRSKKTGDIINY